ncbi:ADP-glyceromanno-heptose 6-epimerase [Flavihumibacter sp. CACIAM 22H1]|uniref:ADP-glyceromanno-heptose 6-epimerase n=1 Tax=Flavihumibacter sp. CACIAM 22H1 TaxID=1812911 RepID=UPI0007A8C240|nr:ADP-glyceromanno-heptose 6-epimerase [Flavihumibacter sp. CACIAM 22H1]KYP16059.1 MAG: ADP-L-glycero-D-mannoheptose-6-epimerase [Flavihumibacter sp. CACIAM 22H1]
MDNKTVIIVTGAAGFIGSCLVGFLNLKGYTNLILVDEFSSAVKEANLSGKLYIDKVDRNLFFEWLQEHKPTISFVFHIGARTDTTEFDYSVHQRLNVEYSQKLWNYCVVHTIPLVYASSAATYGNGELGYQDSHELPFQLEPLNPYGVSKNEFDKWVLHEAMHPPFWAGLKFFNVYGPNEYHKGRMASVIWHSFNQIREQGKVKLFRSHRPDFKDGQQLRDFVYVMDVIKVCFWLMINQPASGLYNLGTGKARSFEDLVKATYAGLDKEALIEFIDMPEDIREKYQYFTEAAMHKLQAAGYSEPFYSLEEGVEDYVRNYLVGGHYY